MTCFDLGFYRSLCLLNWVILRGGQSLSKGYLSMSRNILSCHFWGQVFWMQQVEDSDATKHSKMHRTAPTIKTHPVQKVSGTKIKTLEQRAIDQ